MRTLVLTFVLFAVQTNGLFSQSQPPVSAPKPSDSNSTVTNEKYEIPAENLEGAKLPNLVTASEIATAIFNSIQAQDPAKSIGMFFPREAFLKLKDMPGSEKYYNKLLGWFEDDVKKEMAKHPNAVSLQLNEFKPGPCKWKKIGSEYNKVAYWSCRRSKVYYSVTLKDGKVVSDTIDVLTMINWGSRWYVTHLGPIPAEKKN